MKQISKLISITLILTFGACQQTPTVSSPGIGTNLPSTSSTNAVTLCADGTLNCHVTFPTEVTTLPDVAFQTCITTCLQGAGCSAADQTCAQYSDCSNQCDALSPNGVLGNLPASDDMVIPDEPRKAVRVSVEACIDSNAVTETHFQGTEFRFDTSAETAGPTVSSALLSSFVNAGGLLKMFNKVHRVGRNPLCKKAFKNQIAVTWAPVTDTSITWNNVSLKLIPFTKGDAINATCKMTHTATCGVPEAVRTELNLSQMAWGLDKVEKSDSLIIPMFVSSMFANNNIPYGDTIVSLFPITLPGVAGHMHLDMIMFAASP